MDVFFFHFFHDILKKYNCSKNPFENSQDKYKETPLINSDIFYLILLILKLFIALIT